MAGTARTRAQTCQYRGISFRAFGDVAVAAPASSGRRACCRFGFSRCPEGFLNILRDQGLLIGFEPCFTAHLFHPCGPLRICVFGWIVKFMAFRAFRHVKLFARHLGIGWQIVGRQVAGATSQQTEESEMEQQPTHQLK